MQMNAVMFLQTVRRESLVAHSKDLQYFALMGHTGDIVSSDREDRLLKLYSSQHACKRPGKNRQQ